MNKYLLLFPFLLVLLSSCATTRTGQIIEQGEASWYGPGFHGRQTANGEVYDQNILTAAHRTLPFNTIVQVQNLSNGKSVTVRINDRGPYARGRIIDLSREAARRIDMVDSGVAPVRLILIRSDQPLRTTGPGNIRTEEFTVQLASFNHRRDAEAFIKQLQGSKIFRARVNGRTVYRVYYGRYRNTNDANRDLQRLKKKGFEGFVRQLQN